MKVPPLRAKQVSEDAIIELLGRPAAAPQAAAGDEPEPFEATSPSGVHERGTPKKTCYRCNREISSGTHICPHCHTYIANLGDF